MTGSALGPPTRRPQSPPVERDGRRTGLASLPHTAGAVLALQRAAGNRATSRLIERVLEQNARMTPSGPRRAGLQRKQAFTRHLSGVEPKDVAQAHIDGFWAVIRAGTTALLPNLTTAGRLAVALKITPGALSTPETVAKLDAFARVVSRAGEIRTEAQRVMPGLSNAGAFWGVVGFAATDDIVGEEVVEKLEALGRFIVRAVPFWGETADARALLGFDQPTSFRTEVWDKEGLAADFDILKETWTLQAEALRERRELGRGVQNTCSGDLLDKHLIGWRSGVEGAEAAQLAKGVATGRKTTAKSTTIDLSDEADRKRFEIEVATALEEDKTSLETRGFYPVIHIEGQGATVQRGRARFVITREKASATIKRFNHFSKIAEWATT